MSEWISVEDELPSDEYSDTEYLLYDKSGCMETYFYDPLVWKSWGITHWMPLPKPPI